MRQPVVAIVGRPNVGKSTLFNRLAGRRISIVEDTPGVTRDRLYAEATHEGVRYTLIDTGGFEADPDTQLFKEIREQSQLAIDEADVVVMVVDARLGATPPDVEVARLLRRSGRPVVLAANKVDSPKQKDFAAEFYELGVDAVYPIAAAHGTGIEALLDGIIEALPEELQEGGREAQRRFEEEEEGALSDDALDDALDAAEDGLAARGQIFDYDDDDAMPDEDGAVEDEGGDFYDDVGDSGSPEAQGPVTVVPEVLRLAVIGKPNAGKSSLINKLLGEQRHLVSDIAGTTMDAVDSFLEYGGQRYRLIDTAGIRRKRSISLQMEKYAVVAALRGMDRADIALFVVDALQGITEQDMKVAAFAHDKGRAIIIVVNKWDLARQEGLDAKKFTEQIRDRMPFLSYAPVRFVSAKTGRRVFDLLETVNAVAEQHFTRVSTAAVNRTLRAAVDAHQPPITKNRRLKIYFGTQVRVGPPTFVFAVNDPQAVHFSYRRFLMNRFRETFGFEGTAIRLIFRRRGDEAGRAKNLEARARRATLAKQRKAAAKGRR